MASIKTANLIFFMDVYIAADFKKTLSLLLQLFSLLYLLIFYYCLLLTPIYDG